jgi:hypothetical protein
MAESSSSSSSAAQPAEEEKKTEKKTKSDDDGPSILTSAGMVMDTEMGECESMEQMQFGHMALLEGLGGMGVGINLTPKALAFRRFMAKWITAGNMAFFFQYAVKEAIKHPEHDGKGKEQWIEAAAPLSDLQTALVYQAMEKLKAGRSKPSNDFLASTKRQLTRQDFENDSQLCISVGITLTRLCSFVVRHVGDRLKTASPSSVMALIAKIEWPDGQLSRIFDPVDPLHWIIDNIVSVRKLYAGGHLAAEVQIFCDGPQCMTPLKRGWFEPDRYRHFCDKCVASISKEQCVCLVPFIHPGYLPPSSTPPHPAEPEKPASPTLPDSSHPPTPPPQRPEPEAATAPPPTEPASGHTSP